MKRLLCVGLATICLTSCVVEYGPYWGSPVSRHYHGSHYSYRSHCIVPRNVVPVGHGFDPDPQYVRGFVFRGGDGALYATEH
jgi:hypothetical protein